MNVLIAKALADSTLSSYSRYWNLFNDFVLDVLQKPMIMPVPEMYVALFIVHLEATDLKANTIQCMLSGLAFAHKIRSLTDPTKSFLVRKLLNAIDRKPKSADPRLPVTHPLLQQICMGLEKVC